MFYLLVVVVVVVVVLVFFCRGTLDNGCFSLLQDTQYWYTGTTNDVIRPQMAEVCFCFNDFIGSFWSPISIVPFPGGVCVPPYFQYYNPCDLLRSLGRKIWASGFQFSWF